MLSVVSGFIKQNMPLIAQLIAITQLVALGNHQQAGIDYHETFSSVVKASTVHLILSIAVSCN